MRARAGALGQVVGAEDGLGCAVEQIRQQLGPP
jgi:hypothetical protein